MQFLYRLLGLLRFTSAFTEHVAGAFKELLLPSSNLIRMQIELLHQLHQGKIALHSSQGHLGFEFR